MCDTKAMMLNEETWSTLWADRIYSLRNEGN